MTMWRSHTHTVWLSESYRCPSQRPVPSTLHTATGFWYEHGHNIIAISTSTIAFWYSIAVVDLEFPYENPRRHYIALFTCCLAYKHCVYPSKIIFPRTVSHTCCIFRAYTPTTYGMQMYTILNICSTEYSSYSFVWLYFPYAYLQIAVSCCNLGRNILQYNILACPLVCPYSHLLDCCSHYSLPLSTQIYA